MKPFENELGREGIGYGRFGWQKRRCRDGGNGTDGRVPALCLSHVSPEGVSAENTVVL